MNILTFIFCIFSLFQFLPRNYCYVCPSDSCILQQPTYPDLTVSSEDEIIDGVNYGRLIYMNKMFFLTKDVNISPSIRNLIHQCPIGSALIFNL